MNDSSLEGIEIIDASLFEYRRSGCPALQQVVSENGHKIYSLNENVIQLGIAVI